jgi:hypothetical protein
LVRRRLWTYTCLILEVIDQFRMANLRQEIVNAVVAKPWLDNRSNPQRFRRRARMIPERSVGYAEGIPYLDFIACADIIQPERNGGSRRLCLQPVFESAARFRLSDGQRNTMPRRSDVMVEHCSARSDALQIYG